MNLTFDSNWWGIGFIACVIAMIGCVKLVDIYGDAIYDWVMARLGEHHDSE